MNPGEMFDVLDQARWIVLDRLKDIGTADMLVDRGRFSLSRVRSPGDEEAPVEYEARCRVRLSGGLPVDLAAFFNSSEGQQEPLIGVLATKVLEAVQHLIDNAGRIDDRLDLIRVAAETIVLDEHMNGAVIALVSILPAPIDVTSRPADHEPKFVVTFGIVDEEDGLALFDVEAFDARQLARRFTSEALPSIQSRFFLLR